MSSAVVGALRVNLGIDTAAFSDGLKQANSKLAGFGAAMRKAILPLTAVATGAAVGIGAAVKRTVDAADEMNTVAQQLGVPIEELSRLKYAADQAGVPFAGLQTAFGQLSKNMADAANDMGPAVETFKSLGVEVENADGSLRSSSEVLTDLAEAFAQMPDGTKKSADAMRIFGEFGRTLIPLLNEGAAGLAKMKTEADTFGQVFTTAMGAQADQFNDNMSKLGGAFGSISVDLTQKLLPYLADFSEWLKNNGPVIADFIVFVVDLAAKFGRAAGAVLGFVEDVGTGARRVVDTFINLGTQIRTTLEAIPAQMMQVGRDIISGLWDGIREKFATITAPLRNLASSIAGIFREETDTHSPSRVFAQIGRDLMSGLQVGMEGEQGQVQRGMQSFAQDLAGQFEGILSGAVKFSDALRSVVASGLGSLGSNLINAGLGGILKGIPGFANGTNFAPRGLALVGEHGPELVRFRGGEQVIPNHEFGGGSSVVLNYNPVIDARGADTAAIARLEARMNAEAAGFRDKVMQTVQDPRMRGRR